MSATPPPTLEGTEAPNPFEVLWERYRSLILAIVGALLLAILLQTYLKYAEQEASDQKWSKFFVNIGLEETYIERSKWFSGLSDELKEIELTDLEAALASADVSQTPYFQLAIARKAVLESNWSRAEAALSELETKFPKHPLVAAAVDAVQTRDPKKPDKDEDASKRQETEFEDPKSGSVVALMREQITQAKGFEIPARFLKPEIPADAPKVKFTMGDYGSFTIALMPNAPLHKAAFLKLANQEDGSFWNNLAVDDVHRSTELQERPFGLHFGFASTKDEDSSKWTTTEPSENIVEFEQTGLSHWAGAVAARPEADGKSCADRIWISVDDESMFDGSRVVFGFVVEGLDVLRSICEAGMSAQEEERGQGRPEQDIRVTAVEVL